MPVLHRVAFERNRINGQWRANCSCFWVSGHGEKNAVMKAAAVHDLEWIPDESTAQEFCEKQGEWRGPLQPTDCGKTP